ncbi:CRISPR-associated ring nuclease Csm6 [Psychrobacter piscatorii]|uniref:CRISPR-associated ring nuclease Csm6 n=1 Tax=Psychrobacter piscatorii TaxID=554343 RepID=UPI003735D75F
MSRNILFLVTGMTPQIITETIWALACDENNSENWVPDEVHVLSTQDGLNQIRKRLFEDGVFEQFKRDYPVLEQIEFNPSTHLHVIVDQNGKSLIDLKTPEDNERSADIICEKIKEFTNMEDTSVHVSIAGGRKTMGFYAGYALSLYGRAQDSLSHVLVEEKFEKASNFFYPTPTEHLVSDRDEKVVGNAQEAQVWLAKIPFVRMRNSLSKKSRVTKLPFSTVIADINRAMQDIKITLNTKYRTITVNDVTIHDLSTRAFAYFACFIIDAQMEGNGWSRPSKKKEIMSEDFLKLISRIYEGSSSEIYFTQQWFDEAKSELKDSLIEKLGMDMADKILPQQESRGKPYSLNIAKDSISIIKVDDV